MRRALIVVALLGLVACKKEKAADAPPAPQPAEQKAPATPEAAPADETPQVPPKVEAPKPLDAAAASAFWAWVPGQLDALHAVQTGKEPVVAELGEKLKAIDEGLTFELGLGRTPMQLIISADGDRSRFDLVEQLTKAAPAIEGLEVVAFRPRKDDQLSLAVGGVSLSGADLSFAARPDADKPELMSLEVYVKGLGGEKDADLKEAAYLLLEAALGEKDLETKVGVIDFLPPLAEPKEGLRPLSELPAAMDGWGK